jgi:hypothetical protein
MAMAPAMKGADAPVPTPAPPTPAPPTPLPLSICRCLSAAVYLPLSICRWRPSCTATVAARPRQGAHPARSRNGKPHGGSAAAAASARSCRPHRPVVVHGGEGQPAAPVRDICHAAPRRPYVATPSPTCRRPSPPSFRRLRAARPAVCRCASPPCRRPSPTCRHHRGPPLSRPLTSSCSSPRTRALCARTNRARRPTSREEDRPKQTGPDAVWQHAGNVVVLSPYCDSMWKKKLPPNRAPPAGGCPQTRVGGHP